MNQFSNLYYDDYIMHYGIKGMRWGHRKQEGSERSSRQSSSKPKMSSEKKAKIMKGLAAGAVIGGSVAVAYATRNTPASRKAQMLIASSPAIARAKLSEAMDEASYRRNAKRGAKFRTNNQFAGKNRYQIFNEMNADKTPADIRRVKARVKKGYKPQDAIAKEAVRYGGALEGRYVKNRIFG